MVKEKYKNIKYKSITNFNDSILSIWIKLHKNIYIYIASVRNFYSVGAYDARKPVNWVS